MKYLKEIDDSVVFDYKWIYGEPAKCSVVMNDNVILTPDQDEFKIRSEQRRIIETVCSEQFKLKLLWNDGKGIAQKEGFVFKDNENPQCENYVPLVSKN